jgi:hypothetical protein
MNGWGYIVMEAQSVVFLSIARACQSKRNASRYPNASCACADSHFPSKRKTEFPSLNLNNDTQDAKMDINVLEHIICFHPIFSGF